MNTKVHIGGLHASRFMYANVVHPLKTISEASAWLSFLLNGEHIIYTVIAEAMVKAAAVGGIAMVWAKFTLETFKICKQIVFPQKEEVVPLVEKVVCEECQKPYLDDGECNDCPHLFLDETKHKFLCKICRKNYN